MSFLCTESADKIHGGECMKKSKFLSVLAIVVSCLMALVACKPTSTGGVQRLSKSLKTATYV